MEQETKLNGICTEDAIRNSYQEKCTLSTDRKKRYRKTRKEKTM
jgi:hypothetical protein